MNLKLDSKLDSWSVKVVSSTMDMNVLIWGLVFGSIGLGYFGYGKRQKKLVPYFAGILLITLPYFVANVTALVIAAGVIMIVPLYVKR